MNNQRKDFRIIFVLMLFSIMGLLALLTSPAGANIRVVDVVRLLGIGMCFGVAIGFLVPYLHRSR